MKQHLEQAPPVYVATLATPKPTTALVLYTLHCLFSMLFMSGYMILGIVMIVFAEPMAKEDPDIDDPKFFVIMGSIIVAIFLLPTLMYLPSFFLRKGKLGWYYGMFVVCAGMILGCQPIAIAAIVFWLKPETRSYFGFDYPGYTSQNAGPSNIGPPPPIRIG